uniref:SPARC n=1 Tax=Globodera rostochiensis TaxID=31243 RepID=A0A914IAP4_GLORO
MLRPVPLLLLLITFCALTTLVAWAKKGDIDELEGILDELDESRGDRQVREQQQLDELRASEPNPCDQHVCGWGKECVVDKKGRPICECISKCPELDDTEPLDQVCASNNQTFPSLCHLYRQRCVCKKHSDIETDCDNPSNSKIHLEYLGQCKQLDECTTELMSQFPERMADWLFQVMKELKKRRELRNMEWEQLINEAEQDDEKRHVYPVIWKFCDLDIKPHDKHVSHHELIPITAPVIPMESCIKPFLEQCDTNKDGAITIKEWGKCLGLKEGEIQERC